MNIYEAELKLYVLEDIKFEDSAEKISAIIDKSFMASDVMKEFHQSVAVKGYVFNGFYPIEKEIFKMGNIYSIKIRTLSENLFKFFKINLSKTRTKEMQALSFTYRKLPENHIVKLYSITPFVCKFDNGYWKTNLGLDVLEKRLKDNVIKKYNKFFDTKIDENFDLFKRIEILNKYPIVKKYKNIKFLCDKAEFEIEENDSAQKMARIIVATGLAEMNARGFGYVNAHII